MRNLILTALLVTAAIAEETPPAFAPPEGKPVYSYTKGIPESNATRQIDEYGATVLPQDMNFSNTREIHNLFLKDRDFGAEGMGQFPQMFTGGAEGEVYKEAFSGGKPLSTSELKAKYPESNISKAIASFEDLKAHMKERAALSSDIQCYISRSLNPGFRCSIPELAGVLYGGDARTDYKDAVAKCEAGCSQPADCVQAGTVTVANPTVRNLSTTIGAGGYQAENPTEPSFRISAIELKLSVEENPDSNATLAEGDVLRYGIEVYRPSVDAWFPVVKGGEIVLSAQGNTVTPPIGSNGIGKIRVSFFRPQSAAAVRVETLKIHYASTEHWFCGALQTVDCSETHLCNGIIEQRTAPGGYAVCICRDPGNEIGEDPITGGFYTQYGCQEKCRLSQPCNPEYGDITDTAGFRVEVGCVEPADTQTENPNCTPERCMELFTGDRQAASESVLVNQTGKQIMKQTVVGGKTLDSAIRPKVQLITEVNRPGELVASSTDDYADVFWLEKKDGAFASMIDRGNYTLFPLASAPAQSAAEVKRSETPGIEALSVDWLLKPASADVDDGQNKRLYVVLEIEHTMKAMSGVYPIGGGPTAITLNASKHDIWFKHRTFAVLTPLGFVPYRFQEKEQIGFDLNNSGYKTWRTMTTSPEPKFVQLSGTKLLVFDANTYASSLQTATFVSDQPFYRYPLVASLYDSVENAPGLLVRKQGDKGAMEFSGAYDENSRGRLHYYKFHALYSPTPLSYKTLHDQVAAGGYDIFAMGGEKQYPSEIRGDGSIAGTVKLFMQGGLGQTTVWANYRPRNDELYKSGFFYLMLRQKPLPPIDAMIQNVTN